MVMNEIKALKKELGNKVVIPVHHYQAKDVVDVADFVGDSYMLAVDCCKTNAEFIVFCGVLFMAQCADILSTSGQKVVIPAPTADCPMANMADLDTVEKIFASLPDKDNIAPIVYMNSYADLKSFCGKHGGSVCTSSNAEKIMKYYLDQGKKVLFFPDRNLGINTAMKLGLTEKDTINCKNISEYNNEKVILWDGFCPIHLNFTVSDVAEMRKKYPEAKVIVHPESTKDVVDNSDDSGSTEYILKKIAASPDGSSWIVGTESTFVKRLAVEFPTKNIYMLKDSVCTNMAKTTPELLLKSLQNVKQHIENGVALEKLVNVESQYKEFAAQSLKKMIEIVSK